MAARAPNAVRCAAALLTKKIDAALARVGYDREAPIPGGMSFREWCQDLADRGMKIDRKPFRLDDRPALIPIYDAIPATRDEAVDWRLVIQKATQLGLTVWEVLADVYMAKMWGPINIGLFLPDQNTASFKSEHRFMPIIRSAPMLHTDLTHRMEDGELRRIGEGNVLTREFAGSLLMFLWTSGKVSTESRPMDVVSLDEVQEMSLDQIDKVEARLGDSTLAFKLMLSTANLPDLDINFWYKLGTQEVWHTRCLKCEALSDLSDPGGNFPSKSIAYNTGQYPELPINEYLWCCPKCAAPIDDPQIGEYVAQNPRPASKTRSFLIPRTVSPRITPRKMAEDFARARTGDQKKSFYNRQLARPYIDAEQLPVTMAHCERAAATGMALGLKWEKSGRDCLMGIDQMGGWCAVIIKRRLPDGRQAVVHVEAVFDNDPFARCAELMEVYGVTYCVVEQLPNVNDARRFANSFPRRVFLANYSGDAKADMISWGDAMSQSDRKTAAEDRSRFSVTLMQYKAMQASLFRIRDQECLFPDPSFLHQDVIEDGRTRHIPILSEWVFVHFTKTALVVEQNEETRTPRPKVVKVGLDPHFSYANMLCDVAWSRNFGGSSFFMPSADATTTSAGKALEAMPGLPSAIIDMANATAPGTCGRCISFDAGKCKERGFLVQSRDPSCPIYIAKE